MNEFICICAFCKLKFYGKSIHEVKLIGDVHENNNPGHITNSLPYDIYLEMNKLEQTDQTKRNL